MKGTRLKNFNLLDRHVTKTKNGCNTQFDIDLLLYFVNVIPL